MKSQTQPIEWSDAVRSGDPVARDRFVESHVDLVRYVALRISSRLPVSVEVDDLVHDGVIGLLDAVEKFDPERGVRFRTYAERRVRGAILDGLRHRDWQPRTVRRGQRELDETMVRLSSQYGRPASEDELAAAMGLDLPHLHQLLRDASAGPIIPFDQLSPGSEPVLAASSGQPDVLLERKQLLDGLADELSRLPERERKVLELYYHEQLNMKEVGAVLGVTESRVCQLHSQAAARLRGALRSRLHAREAVATSGSGSRNRR